MDRYQKVEKPRQESTPIDENEIRITSQGRMRSYITYAMTMLQVSSRLLISSFYSICRNCGIISSVCTFIVCC